MTLQISKPILERWGHWMALEMREMWEIAVLMAMVEMSLPMPMVKMTFQMNKPILEKPKSLEMPSGVQDQSQKKGNVAVRVSWAKFADIRGFAALTLLLWSAKEMKRMQ